MHGELPATAFRYRAGATATEREPMITRAPGPAEVVVVVAGSALGAAPGSELAGTVVATGDAALEWLGRRVVIPRQLACGECNRCRRGRTASCRAPFPRGPVASCETVPARFLLSVEPPLWPAGVELSWLALLADAASTPYAALCRGQVGPSDVVVVVGGGDRGRLTAELALAKGATAAVLESSPALVAECVSLGSIAVLADDAAPADLLAALDALPREAATAFSLKIIETTGRAHGRALALALGAQAGATVVLTGDGDDEPVLAPLGALATGEAEVLGSGPCHPDLLPELCALVVRGQLRLDRHLATYTFDDLSRVLDEQRAGRLLRTPVLVPTLEGGAARS